MRFNLFFDGSCEPNPGGVATYGWVVEDDAGAVVASGRGIACEGAGATNNVAEYTALIEGLKALVPNVGTADEVVVRGDSRLVVEQVNGAWNCNVPKLVELRDAARVILSRLPVARVQWVPREENDKADALSQAAYVAHTGQPYPQRRK